MHTEDTVSSMPCIDLTHTFDKNMPVFPGDPHSQLRKIADVEKDGFTDHTLTTAMHVGTHMDAPLHMIADGKYLSQIPVERFSGPGHLIDARGRKSIDQDLLEGHTIQSQDIVLVLTGFSAKFRESEYYATYPEITEAFAQKLVSLQVSIVGMDTPSPDRAPFPVHKILLGHEVLIIENLTNLEALLAYPSFSVIALPMKLHAEAAPIRVVAVCA